jgi:hypothetical protein
VLQALSIEAVDEWQVKDLHLDLFLFEDLASLDWDLFPTKSFESPRDKLLVEGKVVWREMRGLKHVILVVDGLEVLHSRHCLVGFRLGYSGIHIVREAWQIMHYQVRKAQYHILRMTSCWLVFQILQKHIS